MVIFSVELAVRLFLLIKVSSSYTVRDLKYKSDKTHEVIVDGQQVKYPNFNKVITRIENLNGEVKNKNSYHKIRHKSWNKYLTSSTTTTTTTTEAGLFETYGDLDEDDYFESYEDNKDDDFDYDDDDFSDEDTFDDTFEDIQAEEATELPVTIRTASIRPISRFSEYKWQQYGTMAKVEESRNEHLNLRTSKEQLQIRAALDHFARVSGQSKCLKPSPKVIPVQQEYPNASKIYTPHCTVLHRCADDTGCCKRDTKCQYKSRELVHLYFYTHLVGGTSETRVEKLSFYNHTECECKERTENTSEENAKDVGYKSATPFRNSSPPMNEERCKCPKRFSRVITHKCICDCEDDNEDCIQLKKGKEHFSLTDRMCIQEEVCSLPTCEYGSFALTEGKCPTKTDKFEEYRRFGLND